jgi:MinD superfamily P-loop ATPase
MKEIVVVSGKGGTGKTTLTAAFAALSANKAVLADCDVDAADLHLILDPAIQLQDDFICGREAVIQEQNCSGCGKCFEVCRFGAVIAGMNNPKYRIDPISCEGCGVCVRVCQEKAIDFQERKAGEWFVSETRFGPLVHAKLEAGGENSGKLVSLVRKEARSLAAQREFSMLLVDGPPGIGCPVIASITGAHALVVVTEPTLSGKHDLERILKLAAHFRVPAYVCVNKWDINQEITSDIEKQAATWDAIAIGRMSYDNTAVAAQIAGQSIVENGEGIISQEVKQIWEKLMRMMH